MKQKFVFTDLFKALFVLWSAAWIIILPLMTIDAGVTEDEPEHNAHGQRILAWYEGKDSTASISPFDASGQWVPYLHDGSKNPAAINIYGGFFDFIAAFLHHAIFHQFMGIYEFKHILSALCGAALLIFTGLIAQRITGSWRAALLTIVITSFTPRLIGNSLSNPKDIPLATLFSFSLLQIISFLKELPKIRVIRLITLALSFSFAIAVRSGALVLVIYFLLFLGLYLFWLVISKEVSIRYALRVTLIASLTSLAGYIATALFWPWDISNPLLNPIRSLTVFNNFSNFNTNQLFEGNFTNNLDLPWHFVPKWLYITLPVTVVTGSVLFLALLPRFFRKGKLNLVICFLLLFSFAFPVVSIIVNKSSIYDSARHLLFIWPPIIVLASLGWHELFRSVKDSYLKLSVYSVFAVIIAEPALFVIRNNPVQATYFSPLIGGTKAAFRNYTMDYWGYAVKPAIDWIEKNDTTWKQGKKVRVRLWYGEQTKLKYYTDKSEHLQYVLTEENSTDWDYSIVMAETGKYDNNLIYKWPPLGTVHEVDADGAPLCAIVKNFRIQPNPAPGKQISLPPDQPVDSATYYITAGYNLCQAKDYNHGIISFKKALSFNEKNIVAWNNLVATYNQMQMLDDAIECAKRGLAIDPKYQLLKNNLKASLDGKKVLIYSEAYYINLSYNYYVQQNYPKCIDAARKALKLNPKNVVAWNNICSAYNELKEFKMAAEAGMQGLKIDSSNQMLKNNLREALRSAAKM